MVLWTTTARRIFRLHARFDPRVALYKQGWRWIYMETDVFCFDDLYRNCHETGGRTKTQEIPQHTRNECRGMKPCNCKLEAGLNASKALLLLSREAYALQVSCCGVVSTYALFTKRERFQGLLPERSLYTANPGWQRVCLRARV